MREVDERFLQYARIETTSDPKSRTTPTTKQQFDLAKRLMAELGEMELSSSKIDNNGYVIAKIPSNLNYEVPAVGFIAHLDTAPDASSKGVKPQIFRNYQGGDLLLNKNRNIVLSPDEFPELLQYKGQDIITTDGTTLLGADDKAGIAEIMTAIEYLIEHPEIKHGTIYIAFTPDEEVGAGTKHFNLDKFKADYAYTIDGGGIGQLEYENFNAAKASISINGKNVHPGGAKGKMINAIRVGMELNSLLPENEKPEYTEGYEGFFHLVEYNGSVGNAYMEYIIRDHDISKFEEKKDLLRDHISELNNKYGDGTIQASITDQYYNMREKIEPVEHIIDIAKKAMEKEGITPRISPIRGGTDGAHLSFKGLPTPNLFTGGHNFHGEYEFIPIQSMHKSINVILNIIQLFAEKDNIE